MNEIKIGKHYRVKSTWKYRNSEILTPVPMNEILIKNIDNDNIVFEYKGAIFKDHNFLLSLNEFIEKLNPILISN